MIGSVSEAITRNAKCDVLIVRNVFLVIFVQTFIKKSC
ncbi:universal stress protein [Alkalihalobacillus sp. BA299]|nr:universal stress protein [Alkalihalobacillus sp. BA299]